MSAQPASSPPSPGRRRLLTGAVTAPAALVFAGCAVAPGGIAPASRRLHAVAPGAWMLQGLPGEVDETTLGRIGNAGFVVGPRGVVVVDAGVSYRHGRELLDAIGATTRQPVRQLFITHARQEFLFGAAAFRERGIPVAMSTRTSRLMTARCEACLKTLNRLLGEEAMRGTTMFKPDIEFDEPAAIGAAVSEAIGRPLAVLGFGHASGPGDIALLDAGTGTLFAGGLADHRRVPDVQDGDLPGWRRALEALAALPLRHVVPGHGPAAGPHVIADVRLYLDRLEARLVELLRADTPLSEVPDGAALPAYETWDQYAIVHRRNAAILFVRMERDQLVK